MGRVGGYLISITVSTANVLAELSANSQPHHENTTSLRQRIRRTITLADDGRRAQLGLLYSTFPGLPDRPLPDLVLFGFFSSPVTSDTVSTKLGPQISALVVSLSSRYSHTRLPPVP